MRSVVLVHGAFNELWGPHELASRWIPALQDGLHLSGATIDADEVDVCFYGDLFRHDPSTSDAAAWARTRAGAEDLMSEFAGPEMIESMRQLAGAATFERTVDMFATMIADPTLTERVQRRILDEVESGARVVVAHSLGTVVTHRVLRDHAVDVDTLVTVGSPLGAPPFDADPAWPGAVRRWVNVVAPTDPVTEAGRVPALFGARVEEITVDNGHRGHHPEPYLNSRQVGEVVAAALGSG